MNNLKTSKPGKDLIEKHEGKINNIYIDPVGFATVGIGHLVVAGENFPHTLTDEQVYQLFDKDIVRFEDAVNKLVKVKLNQNQFDALVSFTFNLGLGALKNSTLLKVLNSGNYKEAAKQFLRWDKAGSPPKPLPGLTKRRKEESELFASVMIESDFKKHWSAENYQWCIAAGIITGENNHAPGDKLTWAEMVSILKSYDNYRRK